MNCCVCQAKIKNTAVSCTECGYEFSDDEIQSMLDVVHNNRINPKKKAKIILAMTLVFLFVLGGCVAAVTYFNEKTLAVLEARADEFAQAASPILSEYELFKSYVIGADSATITIDMPDWKAMDPNERKNMLKSLQTDLTGLRSQYLVNTVTYYEIQVFDIEGNALGIANIKGDVSVN